MLFWSYFYTLIIYDDDIEFQQNLRLELIAHPISFLTVETMRGRTDWRTCRSGVAEQVAQRRPRMSLALQLE